MENDIKEKEFNDENIFKIDYKGQNLKKNNQFLNWKNMMLEKYGYNAKIFYCNLDKIFFCSYQFSCRDEFFKRKCPFCNYKICYFCGRYDYDCCLKIELYKNAQEFSFSENIFREILFIYLIPYLNSIYLFLSLFCYFASDKDGEKGALHFCLEYLLAIILSIPYIITTIILLIILVVISIPFNFFPFKVFAGFLKRNLPIEAMFLCCFCCCPEFFVSLDDYN